jgi:hypothetical protein
MELTLKQQALLRAFGLGFISSGAILVLFVLFSEPFGIDVATGLFLMPLANQGRQVLISWFLPLEVGLVFGLVELFSKI